MYWGAYLELYTYISYYIILHYLIYFENNYNSEQQTPYVRPLTPNVILSTFLQF